MRQSTLFGRTLRDAPSDAQTRGHQLMLRAAIARQTAAGLYTMLPLGYRVVAKLERIIREEMDRIGCQEMEMSVLAPAELWRETGQWDSMDDILFKVKDRNDHEYVVSYTHEQVVTHHARNEILSYRQLPVMVYHFQRKGRDEARPRAGLLRVREFTMKDAYSIDADPEGLDRAYRLQHAAYARIFARMDLEAIDVESDASAMGGDAAQEFQVLIEAGEDRIVLCSACDYRTNMEMATRRVAGTTDTDTAAQPRELSTPGTTTIDGLSKSLGRPPSDLLKTILLRDKAGQVTAVVLPGDREVNDAKLRKVTGGGDLTFANDADFAAVGGIAGFIGPVGLKARIVVDTSVERRAYIAGANRKDTHLENVVAGRDFDGERADVHDPREGDECPRCGSPLQLRRGVEVGNIFKLGTYYSDRMNASYLAADGTRKPFVMGSYGIGVGRSLQTIVETHHDERGIVWPFAVAPFEVHLVALPVTEAGVRETAEAMHAALELDGIEVLFDDREESAGVKFADADLIGIPLRVTVSKRGLAAGTVELKLRNETEATHLPAADASRAIADTVRRMREAR